MWQRDRAISDAINDGREENLGPEIENELDGIYLEAFLKKIGKQQKQ